MPGPALKLRVLLPAFLLLLSRFSPAQSNVYSLGVYAGGTTYSDLCRFKFPFAPQNFHLTQMSWREDANGFTIMDFRKRDVPGATSRRFMRVECGDEKFTMPLDFLPPTKSSFGDPAAVVKGKNDLVQLVMHCLTNRGGHLSTNKLPVMPMSWRQHSRDSLVVIVGEQHRFAELQKLLEHSYGSPDVTLRSDVPVGNGRSIIYTPQQIGVILVLTDNSTETIVSIIGKPKK